MDRRQMLRERIKRMIRVDPETGCWRWTGSHNNQGYPRMSVRIDGEHVTLYAHRVSLSVFVRKPVAREEAAHDPVKCPHKNCVRPSHLRWATRAENEADKRHPSRLRIREVPAPMVYEACIT